MEKPTCFKSASPYQGSHACDAGEGHEWIQGIRAFIDLNEQMLFIFCL